MHLLLLPLLLSLGAAPAAQNPDIAVVCPAEFRAAMQPWLARRQLQGHVVEFISNQGPALQIREHIRTLAKSGKLQFIVLVGDPPAPDSDPAKKSPCTPTFRIPATASRLYGAPSEFDTDNPYADLDDDGIPDVAIGRLTAHTPEQLSIVVKKILAYEDSQNFGPWRARINFVAGEGGYGQLIDAASGVLARQGIRWLIPGAYQTILTDARWRSPYCPDPRGFHACSLDRINEGCLFWVFMGHGAPQSLQWAVFPDGGTPILQCDDCAHLHGASGPPIMLLMCCYTGAFAQSKDCLSEELLRAPGGPVAVFSGSSETMPYGMAALSQQAIRQFFVNRRETLGQWLLYAKRDTMAGYNLPIWSLIHALTVAVTPELFQPKEERLEHLQLFNLFGDPTMTLHQPREVNLSLPAKAAAGDEITIKGRCSVEGTATVELVLPWDCVPTATRETYDGSAIGRERFSAAYRAANNPPLVSVTAQIHSGSFSTVLPVPKDAIGTCAVRVFVEGANDFALGSGTMKILNTAAALSTETPKR
ncbi:MAG TPA: C25 family cysteine peptidase [Pirellulales bacterium]|nr:C25 family cysteine peptidase [Pirellulales bacterium]